MSQRDLRGACDEMTLTREQVQKFHEWSISPFPMDDTDDENDRYRKKCEAIAPWLAESLLQAWDEIERLRAILGPVCRVCGCTEYNACESGCCWVEPDLCSACVDEQSVGSV